MFNLSFLSPVSQELSEKLNSEDPNLSEILLDQSCLRALQLLDLTLNVNENNHQLSAKAFSVLTSGNDKIFASILEDNAKRLNDCLDDVFTTKDPIKLNRIAKIIQSCFVQPNDLNDGRGFDRILDFLNYCDFRSVFDLFCSIIEYDGGTLPIQDDIHQKLASQIVGIIKNTPTDLTDDRQILLLTNLFKLISLIQDHPLFEDQLTPDDFQSLLLYEFTGASTSLLNAKWAAICSVESTMSFSGIIAENIKYVLDKLEKIEKFMPYHETILLLIGKVATVELTVAVKLKEEHFGKKLAELVRAFPKHSNIHIAVVEYYKKIHEVENLNNDILESLLPVVIDFIKEDASVEMRSFAWNLSSVVMEQNNEIKLEEKLGGDAWKKIEEIKKTVDTPYGGDLPQQEENEPGSDLSSAQIQLLLRFLMANSQ
ncbi:uncharacterized protein GO595_005601 [Histomonas meleagridis]|uniref:uncharacterized protein n=1 Tax=Histomonas meleagridis TaxID=135588 RepID=UPI00355A2D08|nr:hypothetical protein GO595_005601 [Histomonas meleagridis]